MKNVDDAFREADRLPLPPGLWDSIASRVKFVPENFPRNRPTFRFAFLRENTGVRLAASLALAALLIGIGLREFKIPNGSPLRAGTTDEVIDSELLAWSADLGEMDEEIQDPAGWSEK